ncbi:hypothetical protein DXV65_19020 [Pseudomonas fluorescens]|nr:hypothetical protein DXV65_19020 [Pseudomonas fluorescens]
MRGVWESGARQCPLRLHNLKLRQHAVNKVGAGLLAKAQDQSINELTDTPPSQASQLVSCAGFKLRMRAVDGKPTDSGA